MTIDGLKKRKRRGVFRERKAAKKAALFEKSAQKLLLTTAFERPQHGRSEAVVDKSFWGWPR